MKKLLALLALCLSFIAGQAQQKKAVTKEPIITTKTVVLHRAENSYGDTLYIPIVSNKYPRLKAALAKESLFSDSSLAENVKRYQDDGSGITSLNYDIPYQDQNIISIHLNYESMNAHPDEWEQWDTFDIHTGKAYPISKEINPAGLKWIYQAYKARYKKVIKEAWIDQKSNSDKADLPDAQMAFDQLSEAINKLTFANLFVSYVFTTKGLLITSPKVLSHYIQAYEPDHTWLIPYSRLRQYKIATARVIK
jgi:hypothetical protein